VARRSASSERGEEVAMRKIMQNPKSSVGVLILE
jgi:hypothetical protein